MLPTWITMFIDSGKIGGWVRAGVASVLPLLIAKYPLAGVILDPATQTAVATVASAVAVGLWSHYAKS